MDLKNIEERMQKTIDVFSENLAEVRAGRANPKILDKIMDFYLKHPLIKLLGFHSHIGSQITEVDAFIKNGEVMIELSKKLESKYNYPITDENLGGGFGIKYTDEVVSLSDMLEKLAKRIDELVVNTSIKKVYIEPGRSIVGRSGMTLYTGSMIKTTYGGKKYLFVDGGMYENPRYCLYQAKYTAVKVKKENFTLFCFSNDNHMIPASAPIGVKNAPILLAAITVYILFIFA